MSLSFISQLNRPEYFFRPRQILRRVAYSVKKSDRQYEEVILPWGVKLKVRPDETIGRSMLSMGVYDLSLTETLCRLIDAGETAIDIGANIGYVTSVMANRVGQKGLVYSFEPHPEIYKELTANEKRWREDYGWRQIKIQRVALSNKSGTGFLSLPAHFNENRGTAFLASEHAIDERADENANSENYLVSVAKLDDLVRPKEQINVLKLDVEGHELEVLEGASALINRGIRDIIFEEHRGYPSPVTIFLESYGYVVFNICKGFWGPRLESPSEKNQNQAKSWEPPNYLATKDRRRAVERMSRRGWASLSGN